MAMGEMSGPGPRRRRKYMDEIFMGCFNLILLSCNETLNLVSFFFFDQT